ncbi:Ribonuclease P protein component [bioreactor metagenome]|uniref:Ribonuclease P protein component n=1 Tax=bioreactor metagenome TaxID=1076179 RepID=A0A644UA72_9ZZZZ|nr:ribonuclease P protein component [Candidatus Elulimicrobiales bacterium]
MLKKLYKLTSLEIKSLFTKDTPNKVVRGVFFDIKYVSKKEESSKENFKFAIVLSQKNFKKAVERNKIRRQIFSILENYLKQQNLKKEANIYFLIYPKKEIRKLKFLDLKKEVYNVLDKIIK